MRTIRLRQFAAAAVAALLTAAAPQAAASPDSRPLPALTVLTAKAGTGIGAIFLAPLSQNAKYANGVEILSPDGKDVLWSKKLPQGQQAADFKKQTYQGKPVLTWWQGAGLGGLTDGVDVIYDDQYRKIGEVRAANGYATDGHEFLITPRNTALVLAYAQGTADLRSIGGPANQKVIDGVVQEIDIRTGKLLFQWKSSDHVPYSESRQPLPASAAAPWDWFHVNAVKVDTDGALLIDSRDTWTAYKVDRQSGAVLWRLGGAASSFVLDAAPGQKLNDAGTIFAWQHDVEPLGDGTYRFFDNEAAGRANTGKDPLSVLPYSRQVTVQVDTEVGRATLVESNDQPAGLSATSQGNAQTLHNGDVFVGWGALPHISEFDPAGTLLFDARLPQGVNTYRAYRFPWPPKTDPSP